MPNPNRMLNINFNVLLSDQIDRQLIDLAAKHHLTKAQVIRQAIHNWATMESLRTPICADGQTCRCPHAHIYPPSQPASNPPSYPPQDDQSKETHPPDNAKP